MSRVQRCLGLLALGEVVRCLPQLAHPGAGESDTQAATTQVGVTVATVPTAATTATTTYDNGMYTWKMATTSLTNPKTLTTGAATVSTSPTSTTIVPVVVPATTSSTSSVTSISNAIVVPLTASTTAPSTTQATSMTSSSSSTASIPSIAAADASTSTSSTSGGGSHVVIPLIITGAVLLCVFVASLVYARRERIGAWWSRRQPSHDHRDWSEKRDYYDDAAFDPYGQRHRHDWPDEDGGSSFRAMPPYFADTDRYGNVSSMRPTSQVYDGVEEECGDERGWTWGTRPPADRPLPGIPTDRDLLANHDHLDAMLAQSRTGYLPSEAYRASLQRQPSLLERAGHALSFGSTQQSRRIARLSGDSANGPGAWDDQGNWRPLPADEEVPDGRPSTPSRFAAFSGVPDSVRKPLVAAQGDTSVSRSVRRWNLADDEPPRSASPSPTKAKQSSLPASLVSGRMTPTLSHSVQAGAFRAPAHPGVDTAAGQRHDAYGGGGDAFGPYTALPRPRSRSPTKMQQTQQQQQHPHQRPVSRASQRSGSLTALVSRMLEDDDD